MTLHNSKFQGIPASPEYMRTMARRFGLNADSFGRAVSALSAVDRRGGDVVQAASAKSGIDARILDRIFSVLGGELPLSANDDHLPELYDDSTVDDVMARAMAMYKGR